MKVRKRIQDQIKKVDMFGHIITFNMELQGETHKTTVGGCLTIALIVFVIMLFYSNADMINDNNHAQISQEVMFLNTSESKNEYTIEDSNMFVFFTIRRQKGILPIYFQEEAVRKFIEVDFAQQREDWYKFKVNATNHRTVQSIPAK